jgi:hypothetical protein
MEQKGGEVDYYRLLYLVMLTSIGWNTFNRIR